MMAFLLKSHYELIKFAEVTETKPAALLSSFWATLVLIPIAV